MDDDAVIEFIIAHDESMRQISLTVASEEAITPMEFLQCLQTLVMDHGEKPDDLFEESVAICQQ